MLPQLEAQTVEYPQSDGLPMAETGFHVTLIAFFLIILREFFDRRPDAYVGANMFMYYEPGNIRKSKTPDLFVVFGTTKEERRAWKTWEDGVPAVIFEFTSTSTWVEDVGDKKDLYEQLGVREYFLFDPLQEQLKPSLRGYRLVSGQYRHIKLEKGPPGESQLTSRELGLWLRVEAGMLSLYDQATGRKLLPPPEMAAALREAEARIRYEIETRRAAEKRAQAAEKRAQAAEKRAQVADDRARAEAEARQAAEAELARVRAELEALKG